MYLSTHKPFQYLSFVLFTYYFQKIYRCWIVWGQTSTIISVVIIPSFLAITFLGQSFNSHLISRLGLQFIAGPSSYLASISFRRTSCTRQSDRRFLGNPDYYSKFHPVHSCECPGDGLDCVQDPRGVLGS